MAQASLIERMPLELNVEILSLLTDFESVISAALSCHTLLDALKSYESQITLAVLQLDPSVLPEAYVAGEALGVSETPDKDEIARFVGEHLSVRKAPEVWTVKKALPLEPLRVYAQYFAQKFISDIICKIENTPPQFDRQSKPSRSTLLRFERTIYRFEIYCNLFSHATVKEKDRKEIFFSRFAPWENE